MTLVLSGFSVFEWGVVDARTEQVLTFKPMPHPEVKEPVIYFYGDIPKRLKVKPLFPLSMILQADPDPVKNQWVVKPAGDDTLLDSRWRDPAAQKVLINGYPEDYLFYEARLKNFKQTLFVEHDEKGNLFLHNAGDFPVFDVMCVFDTEKGIKAALFKVVEPGQKLRINPCCQPTERVGIEALMALGFTKGAAQAFVDEWWYEFTLYFEENEFDTADEEGSETEESPDTSFGFLKMSYRLPQSEIDRLMPLRITPKPQSFTRAWWVLVQP